MKQKICLLVILCLTLLLSSCQEKRKQQRVLRTDTTTSGVGRVAIDECFAPVIQEEIDVFHGLNMEALIIPTYASEHTVMELFMSDSMRVAVVTRPLTDDQKQIIKDRKQRLRTQIIAIDGVALIVNKANTDSLLSVKDLRRIMTGEVLTWKELNPNSTLDSIAIAFDSPNSSTVHFIIDSICKGLPLGDNVRAIGQDGMTNEKQNAANKKVIDFVASTPNALGIIGVNWISNENDTTGIEFINQIRVLSVSRNDIATPNNSYKPYAGRLALGDYPLTRNVYLHLTDVAGGLPAGFVTFVAGQQGQRIILKAGLRPGTVPTRVLNVRQSL